MAATWKFIGRQYLPNIVLSSVVRVLFLVSVNPVSSAFPGAFLSLLFLYRYIIQQ